MSDEAVTRVWSAEEYVTVGGLRCVYELTLGSPVDEMQVCMPGGHREPVRSLQAAYRDVVYPQRVRRSLPTLDTPR